MHFLSQSVTQADGLSAMEIQLHDVELHMSLKAFTPAEGPCFGGSTEPLADIRVASCHAIKDVGQMISEQGFGSIMHSEISQWSGRQSEEWIGKASVVEF